MKTNRNQMQVVMPDDTLDEFVSNLFTNEEIEELLSNRKDDNIKFISESSLISN